MKKKLVVKFLWYFINHVYVCVYSYVITNEKNVHFLIDYIHNI